MDKLKGFFKYIVSASFVGIAIGLLGLYYELRSNVTHMSMDIAAESNVLDVRHPVPDLAILFQGRDIEAEKSDLKILTVRVVNDGSANILENEFRQTEHGGSVGQVGGKTRIKVENRSAYVFPISARMSAVRRNPADPSWRHDPPA